MPITIGPRYFLGGRQALDILRGESYPGCAIADHGIAGIIAACDDDSQVDRALETTCVLYPPMVCGTVVIPVIGN